MLQLQGEGSIYDEAASDDVSVKLSLATSGKYSVAINLPVSKIRKYAAISADTVGEE